jgi:hypothetical protein
MSSCSDSDASARGLRLVLAPQGAHQRLDGAWWPYSQDLERELPALVRDLDRRWGRITHVTVNHRRWPAVPHQVQVGPHQVRLGWFDAEQDRDEISLFSYQVGRWDLLVVPPATDPVSAASLMSAASREGNARSPSALVEEGAAVALGGVRRRALG